MAYNGWKNYETWNVALWIREGAFMGHDYWAERASKLRDVHELAEEMRGTVTDEAADVVVTGPFADLLSAALSEVNWHEIAEHYTEDA